MADGGVSGGLQPGELSHPRSEHRLRRKSQSGRVLWMKKMLVGLLAAGAMTLALGPVAEAKGFTAKDLMTVDRLSDPRISPDGRYVIYARRVADYEGNKATTELWLVDLNDRAPAPVKLPAS